MNKINITLNELYEIALQLKNKYNNKKLLQTLKDKYNIIDLANYPDNYDPFFAIELFLNNQGVELWKNSHNITYVNNWLKTSQYPILQHPLTGDTIFHKNPNIIQLLNLDVSLYNVQNFDGVPVEYNKLTELNFI